MTDEAHQEEQKLIETAADTNTLAQEIARLRSLERATSLALRTGAAVMLPGNVCFLPDGRAVCYDRDRGDSRHPYGCDGFSFWVHASGYMYGNDGLFFLFLPTQDGQEPQIAFFAGRKASDAGYQPVSLLPVPYLGDREADIKKRYTVIGRDAAYFVTETAELSCTVRVFVDLSRSGRSQVAFTLHLANRTETEQELYVSAYMNPFCRHQFVETFEDRWFKKVYVESAEGARGAGNGPGHLPPFVAAVNEDMSRFRSVTNRVVVHRAVGLEPSTGGLELQTQVCTSRRGYAGRPRYGLAQATFLKAGHLREEIPLTVFNDNAIVGDLNRFRLPPGASIRFDYLASPVNNDGALHEELCRRIDSRGIDQAYAKSQDALANVPHDLEIEVRGSRLEGISDATLNHFFPFLRRQVQICAETKGFQQPTPNSLIGIRDVFQAVEGYLFDRPEAARAKIREALDYVLVDGRCPRQYSLPVNDVPGRADLREFIDQGAWVVSTLHTYLAVSGDHSFLDEPVGYHRVSPVDENALERADERDSVLGHLLRIMDYLARNRDPDTGLVLALYGDWNDALDGLGTTETPGARFGTGVSVTTSLQFYRNCAEMIEILTRFYPGRYDDQVDRYRSIREGIRRGLLRCAIVRRGDERRIVHGWGDARSYLVGSFCDSDGRARDGLTANAFWVICDMLREDVSLRGDILKAMTRLDSPFGLKTFEPGFAPDAPGVGRIPKLPIGTAENGATYVHATLFGVTALFMMNEPKRAWAQVCRILPFSPQQHGISHSPFVMPNSYVYNPDLGLTGQSMNDWLTGSSNVLLKTLIRFVFGFRPEFDGVRIAPAAWCPLQGFRFRARAHGRRVLIVYERRADVSTRRFALNGEALDGIRDEMTALPCVLIPYDRLSPDRDNTITVVDGE